LESSLENGLKNEAELFAKLTATEDMHEGVAAFLEKRRPQFKDR
jgi:enoyl-CoA hydratase/carnithine racemase